MYIAASTPVEALKEQVITLDWVLSVPGAAKLLAEFDKAAWRESMVQLAVARKTVEKYADTEPTTAQLEALNNPDSGPYRTSDTPTYRETLRDAGRG